MPAPRKPTNVLELKGAFRRNPKRKRARGNEPPPNGAIGRVPGHLSEEERNAWRQIVRDAPPGVLCKADRLAVESAARCLAILRETDSLRWAAELRHWLVRLGMTPADRSRVSAPSKPKGVGLELTGQ